MEQNAGEKVVRVGCTLATGQVGESDGGAAVTAEVVREVVVEGKAGGSRGK